MKWNLKNVVALSIIPQIILVKVLGLYPQFIENYYSEGLYPFLAKIYRSLLGWLPYSFGDLAYALLIFLGLRYVIKQRKHIVKSPRTFIRDLIMVLAVVYFTFHLLWGFNYYRAPIASKFNLEESYTKAELHSFVNTLIKKTNALQFQLSGDSLRAVNIPYDQKQVFDKTIVGYEKLSKQYPFFKYDKPSLKKSLFSTPLTYMGYGGYLNPFTNEAQVNARLPMVRFPVVCGHEIGHQLGYSAENETNFIGYLVTASNDDIYFQYAAYAYALGYCLSDIKRKDEAAFEQFYEKLHPGIKKNYKELADFWKQHENPLEPLFKSAFNTFLKANSQKDGIKSYSKVVSLLVIYHRKFPLEDS